MFIRQMSTLLCRCTEKAFQTQGYLFLSAGKKKKKNMCYLCLFSVISHCHHTDSLMSSQAEVFVRIGQWVLTHLITVITLRQITSLNRIVKK